MENQVSIRVAREADATDLASLTAQLGYQVKPPELRSRLSRILERTDQRFIVAEDQRQVVGWVHALVVEYVEANPLQYSFAKPLDPDGTRELTQFMPILDTEVP